MIVSTAYTGFPEGRPLNPLQEEAWRLVESNDNIIVCGKTGSGKSTVVPMYGLKHLIAGKKVLYTGPLKALVEEKREEWAAELHPWNICHISVISGDYVYDSAKIQEISEANVISITPESLISILRNPTSARSSFLADVGVLFFDEIHMVAEEGRGSNLEAAIMEFANANPEAQLCGLSGTIPNYPEFVDWFTNCNGKPTHLVYSEYRPVPIRTEFIPMVEDRANQYDEIIRTVTALVECNDLREEQIMIGVHNKWLGSKIEEHLIKRGHKPMFHNADRTLEERRAIEFSFRNQTLRLIICTSTLFAGVNLPAPNVINTAVARGNGDWIPAATINQLAGRAGRAGLCEFGRVVHFVPAKEFDDHVKRIEEGEPIMSTMHDSATLASHFLGAVHLGRIQKMDDFEAWYQTTLAHVQKYVNKKSEDVILRQIINDMTKRGMLEVSSDNVFALTKRGKISAQMMINPYHFFELIMNFYRFFDIMTPADIDLVKAVGCCAVNSARLSRDTSAMVPTTVRKYIEESKYHKVCSALYCGLTKQPIPQPFRGVYYGMRKDLDRLSVALVRASVESESWKKPEKIQAAFIRLKFGCSWADARMQVAKFNVSESKKLTSVGITTVQEAMARPSEVVDIIGSARARKLGIIV